MIGFKTGLIKLRASFFYFLSTSELLLFLLSSVALSQTSASSVNREQQASLQGRLCSGSARWRFAFFVCVFLFLLQVAAIYRDPSVGNLINVMIVKLIVIHNEQVSAGVATCVRPLSMSRQVFLA